MYNVKLTGLKAKVIETAYHIFKSIKLVYLIYLQTIV